MADSDAIHRAEERAKEAEAMLEVLRKHLQDLTDKAAKSGLLKGRELVDRLVKENEVLKQEINDKKKQLEELESTHEKERAKKAEQTIELLKKQLQDLREKAAGRSGLVKRREHVARLAKENEGLKQEINNMKKRLTELESLNGKDRAKQAEKTIEYLKKHLQDLTDKAGSSGLLKGRERVARLAKENEGLKQEINDMKKQLTELELANGTTQVTLPAPGEKLPHYPNPPSVKAPVSGLGVEPPAATAVIISEGTEDAKKSKKKDKKKGKKEPSPAPDEAAAGDAKINVSRLNMKIGRILSAKHHPSADTLYVEEVDIGEEATRTVASGLVGHIPLDQMQNRLGVFLVNLKPAKMRGILSEAMIMCSEEPGKIEIIDPPAGCVPGDRVVCEEYPGEPDQQLNPKRKVWERVQPDLRTNSECVATYKGAPFTVVGKGVCKVPTMANAHIK